MGFITMCVFLSLCFGKEDTDEFVGSRIARG